MAAEQGLARSAEEEKILRDIRDEKEKLWMEIQVQALHENVLKGDDMCRSWLVSCIGDEKTDNRY